MTDLLECRKEIDVIDKEILRLFEKRMKVCEDVAEYKIHTGKKVLDPKCLPDKRNRVATHSPSLSDGEAGYQYNWTCLPVAQKPYSLFLLFPDSIPKHPPLHHNEK